MLNSALFLGLLFISILLSMMLMMICFYSPLFLFKLVLVLHQGLQIYIYAMQCTSAQVYSIKTMKFIHSFFFKSKKLFRLYSVRDNYYSALLKKHNDTKGTIGVPDSELLLLYLHPKNKKTNAYQKCNISDSFRGLTKTTKGQGFNDMSVS